MDTKKDFEDAITQFHGNYILMFAQKIHRSYAIQFKRRNLSWFVCVLEMFGESKSFVGIFVMNYILIFLLIDRCYFFNTKHLLV